MRTHHETKAGRPTRVNSVGLLVEIGTEELPPNFQRNLLNSESEVVEHLARKGIRLHQPVLYVTIRRIALISPRVEPDYELLEGEIVGPPLKVAFDADGKPTQAAIGFAARIGRNVTDLYSIRRGSNEYLAGRQKWQGSLSRLLEGALPDWIAHLAGYAEKRMRWSTVSVEFVRPIRWICALLGNQTLNFEFAGIQSGRWTRGHRWVFSKPIRLSSVADYEEIMEKSWVNLTLTRESNLEQMARQKFGGPGRWSHHPTLPMMLEYPSLGISRISPQFERLPQKLIETVLRDQMKCLLNYDEKGAIVGRYAFTIDRPPGFYDEEIVRQGYDRLAEARLTDAAYFYELDSRTPFDDWRRGLDQIIFLEGTGTLADKVNWMENLLQAIEHLLPPEIERAVTQWTVRLCRNDQPTRMVREFTNLEGEVGKFYLEDRHIAAAVPENIRDRVALGVRDSYLPRGAEDELPQSPEGAIVSVLDKIVTLTLLFQVGERPTGTSDPLGFRRTTLGLLRILDALPFDFPLSKVVNVFAQQRNIPESSVSDVRDFLEDRWEGWARDSYSLDFDVCEAVKAEVFESPKSATQHALWLQDRVTRWQAGQDSHFGEVVRIATRVHNLAREANDQIEPTTDIMGEPEELEMYQRIYLPLRELERNKTDELSWWNDLTGWLTPERITVIDRFFDKVLVMHENERIRQNRLRLIRGIDAVLSQLGALWKLERG